MSGSGPSRGTAWQSEPSSSAPACRGQRLSRLGSRPWPRRCIPGKQGPEQSLFWRRHTFKRQTVSEQPWVPAGVSSSQTPEQTWPSPASASQISLPAYHEPAGWSAPPTSCSPQGPSCQVPCSGVLCAGHAVPGPLHRPFTPPLPSRNSAGPSGAPPILPDVPGWTLQAFSTGFSPVASLSGPLLVSP